jgi:sec-independent protein translocase protein TatA
MGLGTGEIVLIIVVVVVVFGASRLPGLGEGLGRAIGSFKRALGGANEIVASAKRSDSEGAAPAKKEESPKPAGKAP